MYGTIARFRVRPEVNKEEFKSRMDSFDSASIPGWIADYIFQTDADSDEFYLVAIFKDKESYQANADDPRQHERYLIFRSYLVNDPQWNDGTILSATGPGTKRYRISRSRNDEGKPENRGAGVRPHPCFRVFFQLS